MLNEVKEATNLRHINSDSFHLPLIHLDTKETIFELHPLCIHRESNWFTKFIQMKGQGEGY